MARTEEFASGQPKTGLSDQDREVLDFAKQWWKYPGARHEALLEKFDYGPTTFFQKLNRIIDDPAAMEHDAQTVNRYRRIREQGQAYRRRGNPNL